MVAYSFKQRFVPRIEIGFKDQAIRAERKRHARPGEELQLYSGMRTRHCRLIGRPACELVAPIRLDFGPRPSIDVEGEWAAERPCDFEAFAMRDGFFSFDDMARFWWDEHAARAFSGVLIRWDPAWFHAAAAARGARAMGIG